MRKKAFLLVLVHFGLCPLLTSALEAQDRTPAFQRTSPVQDHRAVLVFDGVNACKPSDVPGMNYVWEEHTQHMSGEFGSTLEFQSGEFAEPFSVMATSRTSQVELAASFDSYLANCREQRKTPFVVFSPRLNIQGYLVSIGLDLDPTGIAQVSAQQTIREDKEWIRGVAPLLLSKLKEAGYEIDAYAHSWGVSMVINALLAVRDIDPDVTLRFLLAMNGRAPLSSLLQLESDGLVDTLARLTTSGDAYALPWIQAAFGEGEIFIVAAVVPDWETWNLKQRMDIHHNVVHGSGSTQLVVEVNGVRYKITLREALLYLMHPLFSSKYQKSLQKSKERPNVRSTENKKEVGIEAGPVAARGLAPALLGAARQRWRSAFRMEELLPVSGPPETVRVGPLSVNQTLTQGNAIEAVAHEFREDRRAATTKAVAMVMKTRRLPYEHDYPICPRFHLNSLDNLATVPLSPAGARESNAKPGWFWFSRVYDNRSESAEVGCQFAVFVNESSHNLIVDSRWVDKQYSPYWQSPQAQPYDYILNFQVWSYSAGETRRLVRSVLRKTEQLPGNWNVTYANRKEPTQPTVFVEQAWLAGDTVHLSVWNRLWLPVMACLHGTKQVQLHGDDVPFEDWAPVYPGRTWLKLPLGRIHNAVVHCEAHGFMDKVFVSVDRTRPAPQEQIANPFAQQPVPTGAPPQVTIIWPPNDAKVRVLRDQLDMPKKDTRLAVNGTVSGAPPGSRLEVWVGTTEWYKQGEPEPQAGLWGARVRLSGKGAWNDHQISARLVDRNGNEIAKDVVKGIVRIDEGLAGRANLKPMSIRASQFGNRRGVSTDDEASRGE